MLFTVVAPSTKWSSESEPEELRRRTADLERRVEAAELRCRQILVAAKARKRCGSWDPNRAVNGSDAHALRAVQRK